MTGPNKNKKTVKTSPDQLWESVVDRLTKNEPSYKQITNLTAHDKSVLHQLLPKLNHVKSALHLRGVIDQEHAIREQASEQAAKLVGFLSSLGAAPDVPEPVTLSALNIFLIEALSLATPPTKRHEVVSLFQDLAGFAQSPTLSALLIHQEVAPELKKAKPTQSKKF